MSQISELKPGSFIFEKKNALPGDVCSEIIERFELNPGDQYQGRIDQQGAEDTDIKRSTDLVVQRQGSLERHRPFTVFVARPFITRIQGSLPIFQGPV